MQCFFPPNNLILTVLNIYQLSASKILLKKRTVAQKIKHFPSFLATREFITAFNVARYWTLSRGTFVQFPPWDPISQRTILVFHLISGLPRALSFRFSTEPFLMSAIPATRQPTSPFSIWLQNNNWKILIINLITILFHPASCHMPFQEKWEECYIIIIHWPISRDK